MPLLRALAACLALLLPVSAQALSCLPWSVENAFEEAEASPDPYVIVTGTLAFDADDLPRVDWDRQAEVPPETRLEARLTGTALGRAGAAASYDEAVRLTVECAGPWCPQLEPDAEYLAFVNMSGEPHALRIGACGGMLFPNPDEAMLARVQKCLDDGDCTPPAR